MHLLPRDTQTYHDFAKFSPVITFAMKNDITCSIIGKIMSFGKNTSLLRLYQTRLNDMHAQPHKI